MNTSIAIIGGGNLGKAIASGLLSRGMDPKALTVTRHKVELLSELASQGVEVSRDNKAAVQKASVVILAVKPYKIEEVLKDIESFLTPEHLLVSVVSDVSIEKIKNQLTEQPTVFRAMPNTASSVNESLTCIASDMASSEDRTLVKSIFDSLGKTIEIDESLMDAATVLGACGIAFVLRFIRGMIQGGIEIGFDAKTATDIATQTVKGASELLLQQQNHPEAEIDKVTTPKGCTIAGLNEMEHRGFSSALIKGIKTSYHNIAD
jgi:pyrroline-5-carboxylate reductase